MRSFALSLGLFFFGSACNSSGDHPDLGILPGDLSVGDAAPRDFASDGAALADMGLACTTIPGNVIISNNQEWMTLVGGGCIIVGGQLQISAPGVTALSPVANQIVSVGSLAITQNDALTSLSLPALKTVGGEVIVNNDDALTSLNFPALTSVGGNFGANNLPVLMSVNLPVLASVGGNLNFIMDPALSSLGVPVLTTTHEIDIDTDPLLPTLSLPALQTTTGIIAIKTNSTLASVSAPLLASSAGLYMISNAALTSLTLPVLTTMSGDMTVQNNAALRQCLVDAVKTGLTTGPTAYTASGNNGMPNTCP